MSLSRPVQFPLLKLPFLCIEAVVKSLDIFEIIFFALSSKKTRRIVKNLNIPLNGIVIFLSFQKWIRLGSLNKYWGFKDKNKTNQFFDPHQNLRRDSLVLRNNAVPLYTSKTDSCLVSYTDGLEITALKMAMEFLNEVFKCSVEKVEIEECNLPESGNIGVKSTVNLCIDIRSFGQIQNQQLRLLLKNLEFSVGSIGSFVTQWFHSDNKKLEYLYILIRNTRFSLENFQTKELNPVPFSGRTRVPSTFGDIDFSEGLEIVRHDGLKATIHVRRRDFLFYIWHNQ